jgi:diguanylate cyclase (GGDEF)-like protein
VALAILYIITTAVLAGGAVFWHRRLARDARLTAERQQVEIRRLQDELGQVRGDQAYLATFLRDVPRITQSLRQGLGERQLPGSILDAIMHTLQPKQALVLVRRRGWRSRNRLVVAAAAPQTLSALVGVEVAIGEGDLGRVALRQENMTRAELAAVRTTDEARSKLDGLDIDLAVPMLFEEETLGVLAVAPYQASAGAAPAILNLIADIGASALHDAIARQRMTASAQVDELTQLFNRRHILRVLSEEIRRAQRLGRGVSIFLFDIDHFKNYNDLHGHVAGDILLRLLSSLLCENMRATDIIGRFGGEEFLVILPLTPLRQALLVADKLRALITAHDFPLKERQPLGFISVSGGVAHFPTHGTATTALIRAADLALYEAKRKGRNCVLCATGEAAASGEKTTAFEEEWS